jgi:RNA-directed DNA polymerase
MSSKFNNKEGPNTSNTTEEAALDTALYAMFWDNINWDIIEERVTKLQQRIVKAIQKLKMHLVKRLQHLISKSFYAKLLAVRKVVTNKGNKSQPLKRVYIEKKGKKAKRPPGIPTMHDRAMQALYALTLDPIAETTADKNSFGFRKYRSCKDAAGHIFNCLSHDRERWILEGDIKSCFDEISHEWLEEHIPIKRKVLREFLKSGYIYKRKLYPTTAGSPQGGIISPCIANMTLDGIEHLIMEKYSASPTGRINTVQNLLSHLLRNRKNQYTIRSEIR